MANTHRVNVDSGNWLALQSEPSTAEVEDNTQVSDVRHFWEDQNFVSFPHGAEYELLEEGLGHNCLWDHIKIGDVTGYFYNKFIEPLADAALWAKYECEEGISVGLPHKQDWTKKAIEEPYYERVTKMWSVSIESSEAHDSEGNAYTLQQREDNAKIVGLKLILSTNGKEHDDTTLTDALNKHISAKVEDTYIPTNLIENMRVLITFPAKYLLNITDATGEQEYTQTSVMAASAVHLFISDYIQIINAVAEIMENYALAVDRFSGTVENIDLRAESYRIKLLATKISTALVENDIEVTNSMILEVGLNSDGTCAYIAENSLGMYRNLTTGIDTLLNNEPFDSSRTMNYLLNIYEIANLNIDEVPWTKFLKDYTNYPLAIVKIDVPQGSSPRDISNNAFRGNPSASENTTAKKMDIQQVYGALGMGSPCESGANLADIASDAGSAIADAYSTSKAAISDAWEDFSSEEDLADIHAGMLADLDEEDDAKEAKKVGGGAVDKFGNYFKTLKGQIIEDTVYHSERTMQAITSEAENTYDDVKDKIFSTLQIDMDRIDEYNDADGRKKIDMVYEEILNRICISNLTIPALSCFKPPAWYGEAAGAIQQIEEQFPVSFCKKPGAGIKNCIPTIGLPDTIPSQDIMAALSKAIWDAIIMLLTQIFVDMVKALIDTLMSVCDDDEEEHSSVNPEIMRLMDPILVYDLANGESGVSDFIADLSDLINPGELCKLFAGEASKRTLSVIHSLIKSRYPNLISVFKTKSSIVDFFSILGTTVDNKMCKDLAALPENTVDYCPDLDAQNEAYRQNLIDRPEELTDEEIQKRLDKAKERKKENIEKLAAVVGMINGAASDNENPFQDLVPTLLCGLPNNDGTEGTGNAPCLLNLTHDSIDFLQDVVINSMFSSVYISFNREAGSYTNYYIKDVVEIVEIRYKLYKMGANAQGALEVQKDSDGAVILEVNPRASRQSVGDQARAEELEQFANNHEGKILDAQVFKKTNDRIKTLLSDVETGDVFYPELDSEGYYYELVLPQDTEVLDAIRTISNFVSRDIVLPDFISDWKVRYKTPYVLSSDSKVVDDYIIEVFQAPAPGQTIDLKGSVRIDLISPLDVNVNTYLIDELNLLNNRGDELIISEYRTSLLPAGTTTLPDIIEGLCPVTTPPDKFYIPYPHRAFGLFVANKWDFLTASSSFNSDMSKYFGETIHPQIARDMISLIATKISRSQLFNDNKATETLMSREEIITYSPELKKVSLDRFQTKCEKAFDIDPHLLRIEKAKSDLRDYIKSNSCLTKDLVEMNTDGSPQSAPGSWELAVISAITKVTVRTYLIDYAMRGIFPLTEFNVEVDDYTIEFLLKKMIGEMEGRYGSEYIANIQEFSNVVYKEMVGARQIIPPVGVKEELSNGLREILRVTLKEVYNDLKCIIEKDLGSTPAGGSEYATVFTYGETRTPKQLLIEKWLPIIDLPEMSAYDSLSADAVWKPRFSKLGVDLNSLVGGLEGTYVHDVLETYLIHYPDKLEAYEKAQRDRDDKYKIWQAAEQAFIRITVDNFRNIRANEELDYDMCRQQERYTFKLEKTAGVGLASHHTGLTDVAFADLFCAGLKPHDPDTHKWQDVTETFSNFRWIGIGDRKIHFVKTTGTYRDLDNDSTIGYEIVTPPEEESIYGEPKDYPNPEAATISCGTDSNISIKMRERRWLYSGKSDDDTNSNYPAMQRTASDRDVHDCFSFGKLTWHTSDGAAIGSANWDDRLWRYDTHWKRQRDRTTDIDYILEKRVDPNEKYQQYLMSETKVAETKVALSTFTATLPDLRIEDFVELIKDDEGEIIDALQRRDLLTKVTFGGEEVSFDLTNGNFFLERFWKIKIRNPAEIEADHPDDYEDFQTAWGAFGTDGTVGPWYYNISEFNTRYRRFKDSFSASTGGGDDSDKWNIGNWFEEFTPGLRLIYLPPTSNRQFDVADIDSNEYPMEKAVHNLIMNTANTMMDEGEFVAEDELEYKRITERAYYVSEKVTRQHYDIENDIVENIEVDDERIVYPIPLLDTTKIEHFCFSENNCFDDCDNPYPGNYTDWFEINKTKRSLFSFDSTEFTRISQSEFINLNNKLIDDRNTEFKLLFDFIFPVNRYLSMFNVYCILASSTMPQIESAFAETKDTLATIFDLMSQMEGYQQGDVPPPEDLVSLYELFAQPSHEDPCCIKWKGISVNLDDLLNGNFLPTFEGKKPKNKFSGLGLKYTREMLKRTGETILKQLAETMDPNIIAANRIRDGIKYFIGDCPAIPLALISAGLAIPPPFSLGLIPSAVGVAYLLYDFDNPTICNLNLDDDIEGCVEPDGVCRGDNPIPEGWLPEPAQPIAYRCEPNCEGRQCGPDGCGGICGDCPNSDPFCNVDTGQCYPDCQPNCTDKECGDDGCGGSCGKCDDGLDGRAYDESRKDCIEPGVCGNEADPDAEPEFEETDDMASGIDLFTACHGDPTLTGCLNQPCRPDTMNPRCSINPDDTTEIYTCTSQGSDDGVERCRSEEWLWAMADPGEKNGECRALTDSQERDYLRKATTDNKSYRSYFCNAHAPPQFHSMYCVVIMEGNTTLKDDAGVSHRCRDLDWVNENCKPGSFEESNADPRGSKNCNIKILCGELYEQGILDIDIYLADLKHSFKYVNTPVQLGYWYLAEPLVNTMRKSKLITKLASPFIISWAEHMAYKEKVIEKDNILGNLIQLIGIPIAYITGLGLNILNTSKVKSYKEKMEALSNTSYEEVAKLIKEKDNKNQ